MDELKETIIKKKKCYDLGGSGGDDINLWWVKSVGVVDSEGSHDSSTLISSVLLLLGDPSDDRESLPPFDSEVGVASTVGSCGEDTILRPKVWAGLGGGVGGASLLPGDDDFMLKWASRGPIGGGVKLGPGLERERENHNQYFKVNLYQLSAEKMLGNKGLFMNKQTENYI